MRNIFAGFLLLSAIGLSQNPCQFDQDVEKFYDITIPQNQELAVFTGSSSIRFWEGLQEDCHQVYSVNTGFGGSQTSDLLYFLEPTILRFKPTQIVIYEGDNDIVALKTPEEILKTTMEVVDQIKNQLPDSEIYLISAKPSPARWKFKNEYLKLNNLYKIYCNETQQLSFIDIWTHMLNTNGKPQSSIFIQDSLHMNRTGYLIWKDVICQSIDK